MVLIGIIGFCFLAVLASFYYKNEISHLNLSMFTKISLIIIFAFNFIGLLGNYVYSIDINILTIMIMLASLVLLIKVLGSENTRLNNDVSTTYIVLLGIFTFLNLWFGFQTYVVNVYMPQTHDLLNAGIGPFRVVSVFNIVLTYTILHFGRWFLNTNHVLSLSQSLDSKDVINPKIGPLFLNSLLVSVKFVLVLAPLMIGVFFAFQSKASVICFVVVYTYIINGAILIYCILKYNKMILSFMLDNFYTEDVKKVVNFHQLFPNARFDLRVITLSVYTMITKVSLFARTFLLYSLFYDLFTTYLAFNFLLILLTFIVSIPNFRKSIIRVYGNNVFKMLG